MVVFRNLPLVIRPRGYMLRCPRRHYIRRSIIAASIRTRPFQSVWAYYDLTILTEWHSNNRWEWLLVSLNTKITARGFSTVSVQSPCYLILANYCISFSLYSSQLASVSWWILNLVSLALVWFYSKQALPLRIRLWSGYSQKTFSFWHSGQCEVYSTTYIILSCGCSGLQ